MRPESIFEVGVFAGYSIAAMLWGAEQVAAKVETVDLMDIAILDSQIEKLKETFPFPWIATIQEDSVKFGQFFDLESRYDIVHIDGGHDYETARSDIFKFGPLVSDRGIIVIDDVKDPNVMKPAEEFARLNCMKTRFVDNWNGHLILTRA